MDLQEERAAIVSALLQLEAFPAGMELFPAADDDAWTLIERVIDSSDYYLLVIGGKYGSIDPESELSYTEKEYDLAVNLKKPVMAFLHGDPDAIEFGKSEKNEAIQQKLAAFRAKVERMKHVKYWTGPDLAGQVALSYANFRQTYPAVGWVRGDVQTATETLTELNELRKQLEAAEKQLVSVRSGPPPGTDELSQGSDVVSFEVSGSTRVRTPAYTQYGRQITMVFTATVNWDDILSAVGPVLLDEALQDAVQRRLNGWLMQRYKARIRQFARKTVIKDEEKVVSFRETAVILSEDDFGTVLVQLRALGLITRSDRKRSVKDKGTYWMLTPYGDERLTTLRAIRRDIAENEAEADAEEDEEDEE